LAHNKWVSMSRKRYTAEEIIGHLRQAEIRTSDGKTIAEAVRELGISEQTETSLKSGHFQAPS
jgi:putative transposase